MRSTWPSRTISRTWRERLTSTRTTGALKRADGREGAPRDRADDAVGDDALRLLKRLHGGAGHGPVVAAVDAPDGVVRALSLRWSAARGCAAAGSRGDRRGSPAIEASLGVAPPVGGVPAAPVSAAAPRRGARRLRLRAGRASASGGAGRARSSPGGLGHGGVCASLDLMPRLVRAFSRLRDGVSPGLAGICSSVCRTRSCMDQLMPASSASARVPPLRAARRQSPARASARRGPPRWPAAPASRRRSSPPARPRRAC